MFKSINPYTGETIAETPEMESREVEDAIDRARATNLDWQNTSFGERAEKMKTLARLLRDRADDLGGLMADEMGKPLAQGKAEAEKCAWVCDYYAENAESFLSNEPVDTDATEAFVAFRPLGLVLAVMPWNFPFWQVFRFAAPALMAGNGCLLKHARNVQQCAARIEELVREAGFPDDALVNLRIPSARTSDVIRNPAVRAVTVTGSTDAGSAVAREAGRVVKKCVLELGGSDPYVVLEDADLEAAAETCVESRLINNGQSCIAAKRFIVLKGQANAFQDLVRDRMAAKVAGNPRDEATDIGPLAREDLRDTLHGQVEESVKRGAERVLGGEIPEGGGFIYPPTVLTNVRSGQPAYQDELFGPAAAIIAVEDEEEAVKVANATSYGLGAGVFTKDADRGRRLAVERIDAGSVAVNDFVRSDPRLPFGGVRESGFGRELSHHGIREFVNIKTVTVA